MSERQSLSRSRVAILGLGLMGGSLALALQGKCAEIIGYDPDDQVIEIAKQMHLADILTGELSRYIHEADMIILAAPVCSIFTLLQQLPGFHPGSPVVMDIGSTKVQILHALDLLPERFGVIGGHPISGKEKSSLVNSNGELFNGAPFILCPTTRTSDSERELAEQLVNAIGSFVVWMDGEEHDYLMAATSHFPYILANQMVSITPDEAKVLVGPGFKSTSRIAASSPSMMVDVLLTNQQNILPLIKRFQEQLEKIKTLLELDDKEELVMLLEQGVRNYQHLLQ